MTAFVLGAALTALLRLDAVSVAQVMVSRPVVTGPLVGAVVGQPELGMLFGFAVELVLLDAMPMGGVIPPSGTFAAGSAALLCAGPFELGPGLALAAGLALGWAWPPVERALRERRTAAYARAESGEPIGPLLGRAVALEFAAGAAFVAAGCAAVGAAAFALNAWLPRLAGSLDFALPFSALVVGLANLGARLDPRRV